MNFTNDTQREPEWEDNRSAWQSLRDSLLQEYRKLLRWMQPKEGRPRWLEYLKWVYKLPIFVFVMLMSPIAFIVLAIVFFATL